MRPRVTIRDVMRVDRTDRIYVNADVVFDGHPVYRGGVQARLQQGKLVVAGDVSDIIQRYEVRRFVYQLRLLSGGAADRGGMKMPRLMHVQTFPPQHFQHLR